MKTLETPTPKLFTTILCLTMILSGMQLLMLTMALNPLAHELKLHIRGVQWLISLYALGNACALLIARPLIANYGKRKLFLIALFLLAISALGIATTYNFAWIIFCAFLHGAANATGITTTMILAKSINEPQQRKKMFNRLVISTTIGIMITPLLSGFLIHYFDWETTYYLFSLLALLCCGLAFFSFRFIEQCNPISLNLWGPFALTITLISLLCWLHYTFTWGIHDTQNLFFALIFIMSLLFFFFSEKNHPAPLIRFTLFKYKNYAAANIVACIIFFQLIAWLLLIGIYLQRAETLPATYAGLMLFPFACGYAVSIFVHRQLTRKLSPKKLILFSLLLEILALALLIQSQGFNPFIFTLAFILLGYALASSISLSTSLALQFTPAIIKPIASQTLQILRWLSAALSGVLMASIFHLTNLHGFNHLLKYFSLKDSKDINILEQLIFETPKHFKTIPETLQHTDLFYYRHLVFTYGFHSCLLILLILTFIALLIVVVKIGENEK